MAKIISRLYNFALIPLSLCIIGIKSEISRIRSIGKKPIVHFESKYNGENILIVALYQKGLLRNDIIKLLKHAKNSGIYIIATNTLFISNPDSLRNLIDCYIERPNFGRDFGSYKDSFLHLFKRGWDKQCSRLIMVNDSIFFSDSRLPKFLDDMMTSDVEVLGSTENFEIEYHLGSFCIAISGSILRQTRFKKYWRSYRLSDVRPQVIRRGEMKLSRTLKRCVSSPNQFSALYGSNRYLSTIAHDKKLADFAIQYSRTSDLIGWKRLSPKSILDFLDSRFIVPINPTYEAKLSIKTSLDDLNQNVFILGYDDIIDLLNRNLVDDIKVDGDTAYRAITSMLSEVFMQGSQIHQNATILLYMGLPIIKLDGLYRGGFNIYDMSTILLQLDDSEAIELRTLLLERPYGGDTLKNWKLAAFNRGLL